MFTTRLLTSCCLISWGVQAYYLDQSCLVYPNFRASVSNAFDFASTAIKLQGDPNVQTLSTILFGSGGLPAALTHFYGLRAISTYQGLGNMNSGGLGDVIIACDLSRYADRYLDGVLYHWDIDGDIVEEDDAIYQACSEGTGGGRNKFAYTMTYDDDTNLPDLIQFCPVSRLSELTNVLHFFGVIIQWFLSYIHAQRWSSSSQVDPTWLVDIPTQAANAIRRENGTPIDLYGLLESTILHELTHTKAGMVADDIRSIHQGVVGTSGWW